MDVGKDVLKQEDFATDDEVMNWATKFILDDHETPLKPADKKIAKALIVFMIQRSSLIHLMNEVEDYFSTTIDGVCIGDDVAPESLNILKDGFKAFIHHHIKKMDV